MTLEYFSGDDEINRLRRETWRKTEQRLVLMGDGLGRTAQNLYADANHYWVRDIGSKDDLGYSTNGSPFKVLGGANVTPEIDKAVFIEYAVGPREWHVVMSDPSHMQVTGRSMLLENSMDPHNQYHRTEQLLPLLSSHLGDGRVNVQGWQYAYNGTYYNYKGTSDVTGSISRHVTLNSYVPAAGLHCYALVTYNRANFAASTEPLQVFVSTAQNAVTAPLDASDIQECLVQMPAAGVRIKAYRVINAAPNNRAQLDDRDLRGWLNEGDGTMSSFNASGDSGTPQAITNGNTLLIAGGTGLSSVASATDTITLNLDNTAVTPAAYTLANITVDAQGRITAAANGTITSADIATALTTPGPYGSTTPDTGKFTSLVTDTFNIPPSATPPATVTSTGVTGTLIMTETFGYYCYNTNLWRRWALSTW